MREEPIASFAGTCKSIPKKFLLPPWTPAPTDHFPGLGSCSGKQSVISRTGIMQHGVTCLNQ